MSNKSPELSAKPFALILPTDEELSLWNSMSQRQRQFAAHWMQSNWKRLWSVEMESIVRKAKEQRP